MRAVGRKGGGGGVVLHELQGLQKRLLASVKTVGAAREHTRLFPQLSRARCPRCHLQPQSCEKWGGT